MSSSIPEKPVTAVIVTYQSARTIGETLAAARRCYDRKLLDVVVVDNSSTDATGEIIGREAGWAHLILTGKNNGFGRGCNIGLAHVISPYTILINPDAVVEPEAIRTMLEFMERNPKAGIVGPATICGSSGEVLFVRAAPAPWTVLRSCIPILKRRSPDWVIRPGSAPCRAGWVCGAVLMIRTELMKRLNGFDPRFFLYWEETDLCKRAEDAGFETWAIGTALAHHVVGASSSRDEARVGAAIAKHYFQSPSAVIRHHSCGIGNEAVEFYCWLCVCPLT
jgi:GT2 family glycosyltransferase